MPIQLICQWCSQPFSVRAYRRKTAFYCSKSCHYQAKREQPITAPCDYCQQPFVLTHGQQRYKKIKHFCSRQCQKAHESRSKMGRALRTFWDRVKQCGHEWLCPYCCWPWTGTHDSLNYGKIIVHKKQSLAHRIAWELANNQQIPSRLVVAHYCHTPICCNPMHLHATTQHGNLHDSIRDGRHSFGERNGHSKFTDATARDVLALHADGWSCQDIALMYNVTHTAISKICLGKTWKHIR